MKRLELVVAAVVVLAAAFAIAWGGAADVEPVRPAGPGLPDRLGIGLEGIFVVDSRTQREHPIRPPHGGLFPAWSPDGQVIGFSALRGRRAGGDDPALHARRQKVRDLGGAGFPGVQEGLAWSPDGRKIAYRATAVTAIGRSGR